MEMAHNMPKAFFIANILVLSTFVPAIFLNRGVLADPAGCCMQRRNANTQWAPNQLTFASCQQLNLALDNDDIFQQTGRVWWNVQCH
jgi:hypothetical protein